MLKNFLSKTYYLHMIDESINTFGYLLILLAIWLLFSNNIIALFRRKYRENRFRMEKESKEYNSKFIEHLKVLISIVMNSSNINYVYTFIAISLAIFLICFLIFVKQEIKQINAVLYSLFIALIPYGILRLRLRTIRVNSSYEGELLITELINQYKINYYNMIEAIDRTIERIDHCPNISKTLCRLSMRIKEYRSEKELHKLMKEFTYAIDTQWSVLLSNNLLISIHDGVQVTASLEDILVNLRDSKKVLESGKRHNNEGFMIAMFLVPIMYVLFIYIAVRYFGFTLTKYFNYQLRHPIGFKFFIAIIISFVANYFIMVITKRQKFDF